MNIIPFEFEKHQIRVIIDESGEPLFVGKDICIALGYADPTNAMKQHCRGVVKRHPIVDTLGRTQQVRILAEGDMFRLIINSTLPSAEKFESLVFDEILPTIRKTGRYETPAGRQSVRQIATNPVKDILLIGKELQKVPEVNPVLAMAA